MSNWRTSIKMSLDPTQIRLINQRLTLSSLIEYIKKDKINLNFDPYFKIHRNLRSESLFIESILIRMPLPAFWFDSTRDFWVVVDGYRRLMTLKHFVLDKNLPLFDLEYLTDYVGMGFDDLSHKLQRRLLETTVDVHLIDKGTSDELKFNIMKRIK